MSYNSVWAAYKVKMKEGNHSLMNRRVSRRLERKHQRDEEINKRRNLSGENDMEEESFHDNEEALLVETDATCKKSKGVKQTKCNDRVERLRKWQEEKKKRTVQDSNKSKKPLFKVGGFQRDSEAILFQSGKQQPNQPTQVSKPAASVSKQIHAVKKTSDNTKNLRSSKSQGNLRMLLPSKPKLKESKAAKDTKTKPMTMRKFHSVVSAKGPVSKVEQSRQPTDMSKKLTVATSSKRSKAEPSPKKSMRRVKSSVTSGVLNRDGPRNRAEGHLQPPDLSKKLTIAAASKRAKVEASPKRNLRRVKSSVATTTALPKKGVAKPDKQSVPPKTASPHRPAPIADQGSSDPPEGSDLSDASVPSPKHSTPHPLKSVKGAKAAASVHKSGNRGKENSRGKSKRKSTKRISPVEADSDGDVIRFFFSDNDMENQETSVFKFTAGQKTPAKNVGNSPTVVQTPGQEDLQGVKRNILMGESIEHLNEDICISFSEDKKRKGTRQSRRLKAATQKEQALAAAGSDPESAQSPAGNEDPSKSALQQGTPSGKRRQEISKSNQRLRRSIRKSTHAASLMEANNHVMQTMSSTDSECDGLNDPTNDKVRRKSRVDKSMSKDSSVVRKSSRKSTRLSVMAKKEDKTSSGTESMQTSTESEEEQVPTSTVNRSTVDEQTPSGKRGRRHSQRGLEGSRRKSSHLPGGHGQEEQEGCASLNIDSQPLGGDADDGLAASGKTLKRKSGSVHDPLNDIPQQNATPLSSQEEIGHPTVPELARTACDIETLMMNQVSELKVSNALPSDKENHVKQPRRKSVRLLTYNEPAAGNDSSTPSKRVCVTPLSVTKSFLALNCNSTIDDAPMAADTDLTPESEQRIKMQSALAKKKSVTPVMSHSAKGSRSSMPRSAGKCNLSDRRSTARGRRSRRSSGFSLMADEQCTMDTSIKEREVSRHSSSTFFEISLDERITLDSQNVSASHNDHLASTPLRAKASPMVTPSFPRRGKSLTPSSAFKEPGLPLSALRIQSASSRRRKTEHQETPLKSPEQMIEILKRSPMVEMSRRKSRLCTTPLMPVCPEGNGLPLETGLVKDKDASVQLAEPLPGEVTCPLKDDSQEAYFRGLIIRESARLDSLCSKWNQIVEDESTLSDDVLGQIRSVVGKAQLLMDQRFQQFSGLVDNYAFGWGEKETTPSDLQGFWDMVYFQVEDVDKMFHDLDQLQSCGWQVKQPTPKVVVPKKKPMIKAPLNSKKVKSNFAAFKNDLMKRKAAAMAASSNTENVIELLM